MLVKLIWPLNGGKTTFYDVVIWHSTEKCLSTGPLKQVNFWKGTVMGYETGCPELTLICLCPYLGFHKRKAIKCLHRIFLYLMQVAFWSIPLDVPMLFSIVFEAGCSPGLQSLRSLGCALAVACEIVLELEALLMCSSGCYLYIGRWVTD